MKDTCTVKYFYQSLNKYKNGKQNYSIMWELRIRRDELNFYITCIVLCLDVTIQLSDTIYHVHAFGFSIFLFIEE